MANPAHEPTVAFACDFAQTSRMPKEIERNKNTPPPNGVIVFSLCYMLQQIVLDIVLQR